MNGGVVQQMGTPEEIYGHSSNTLVAGFVGSPAMNFVPADVVVDNGRVVAHGDGWELGLTPSTATRPRASTGG